MPWELAGERQPQAGCHYSEHHVEKKQESRNRVVGFGCALWKEEDRKNEESKEQDT